MEETIMIEIPLSKARTFASGPHGTPKHPLKQPIDYDNVKCWLTTEVQNALDRHANDNG